ncbi:MAG: universal stress protein [Bacteroidota bacterium]
MKKLFNKILVPIDFSSGTSVAVDKASEIAMEHDCSILLLHVVVIAPLTTIAYAENGVSLSQVINNKAEIEFQLEQLCETINATTRHSVAIEYSIRSGTWDENIIHFVQQNQFDLVLIGQKIAITGKRRMKLNPDTIAAQSKIPVITVPANRSITKLNSIIIPVTDFLPVRKLMYGVYLASSYSATIRLLGVETSGTQQKVMHYMMKAYKLIADNSSIKVEFEKTMGSNVALALKNYTHSKSADLIIVNPGTQTKLPGILSSLLGNIIQRYSSPPVLTVSLG